MLLERDRQLAVLSERLELADAGRGSLVLIGGEAGAGKSSLVARFTGPLGTQAVTGACDPLTMPRPLSPLRDFVDVGDVANIDLFHDVLDRFGRSQRTTVMVIEDIHWADQATLDFVRFVGRRIDDTQLLMLCTFRDDELGADHALRPVLGQLARLPSTVRMNIPMLSIDAVRTLTESTRLDPEDLHQLTNGNAFYVDAVIDAGGSAPASLHDAVLSRLDGLVADVCAVIETVSIAPRSLGLGRALSLGHRGGDIDAAAGAGVILADGDDLRFRHELARSVVEAAIPPARRHELHRSMLALLLDEDAPDHARLAHHAIEANSPLLIARHAPPAARQARDRGATREAAALFQAAEQHADHCAIDDAAGLRLELGTELIDLDRPADALAHLAAARLHFATVGSWEREVDALQQIARAHYATGHPNEAMSAAREAVALTEPHGPTKRLVTALNAVAAQAMLARRARAGRPFAERAAQVAGRLGLRREQLVVEHTQACIELVGGDADLGIERLMRSVASGVELSASNRALILANLGSGAGEVRRYATAIDALIEAEALAIDQDLDACAGYVRAWLSRIAFEEGRWDDAVSYATVVDATASNRRGYALLTALGVLGRVRVRRGDPGGVALLEETLAGFDGHELQYRWSPVAGLAEHHWLRGDTDSMVAELGGPYEEALDTESEWARGELGYWMWKAGAIDVPPPRAAAPFALQISCDTSRAVALWEQVGCPYEAALARSEGAADVAVPALHLLDSIGATPLADRVRADLRAAGIEAIPRGPSKATRAHPLGLTTRQAEVLDLIVEGLSNGEIATRLYVSKKTVEHHVSAVFAKIGVETRAQAIASVR